MAVAAITRHENGTLTYEIHETPGDNGIAEITVSMLVELFRLAGIKPKEDL